MGADGHSHVEARYRAIRADPTRSLTDFWEVSAALGAQLLDEDPGRAEEVLSLAAQSLRERPHPADVELSRRVLATLADARGRMGRWGEQREALEAERRLLEHAGTGIRSDIWRDLSLRLARADLASERVEAGFDHLLGALALAVSDEDAGWFDRIVTEVAVASLAYTASRRVLSELEADLGRARAHGGHLDRQVALSATIALAQLSRDGVEVAEIYEQRLRAQAARLEVVPLVAEWASAAVALAADDVDRAAVRFANLVVRVRAEDPGRAGPGGTHTAGGAATASSAHSVRFWALAGLGDARWRQDDLIGARTVLTEALGVDGPDCRTRARCHELLAEILRRDHRLDDAFVHLQAARELEERLRARVVELAPERTPGEALVVAAHPVPDLPVVVSTDDLERRVESLEQLVDTRTRQLEQALVDLRDLSDRSQLDALTGLSNRQRLLTVLAELMASGDRCAVLVIDLDRFARINDALGHDVGDEMLVEQAHRLLGAVRPRDTIARWGGDEFVVLMPGLRDVTTAAATAEVVRQALSQPIRLGGDEVVPSVSIGVAVALEPLRDPTSLLREADTALGRAKERGKGRVEVYGGDLAHHARRRFDTEALLRGALDHGWFELHFQPVHPNTADGYPLAAEALLRLRDPSTGDLLAPGTFLDVAEETGLAVPIGTWVLDAACEAAARWSGIGVPFRLAVNVSASQLDRGFPAVVAEALDRHRLSADTLVIELTEHTLLKADEAQVGALVDLRETGVRIALDDFGTAYSSLSHLRKFPVDVVKIDRSFVAGICRSDQDNAIVRAVVDLSQTFHFRVIAEGVETTEQLDQQRRLGCHGAQGYLIGRPKPAEVFAELLSTRPMFEALSMRAVPRSA